MTYIYIRLIIAITSCCFFGGGGDEVQCFDMYYLVATELHNQLARKVEGVGWVAISLFGILENQGLESLSEFPNMSPPGPRLGQA